MKKYDLAVVCGGFTGVAAAVSAVRQGLSVILVEKSGALGGAMSNSLVFPFMTYRTHNPKTKERMYLFCGIFSEMRKRQEIIHQFPEQVITISKTVNTILFPTEAFFQKNMTICLLQDAVFQQLTMRRPL